MDWALALSYSLDGAMIYYVSHHKICMHSRTAVMSTVAAPPSEVYADAAFSASRKWLAAATEQGKVYVCHLAPPLLSAPQFA